jgi:hypothetical protein
MPTAKPRYIGDGAGETLNDFSSELRSTLREHFPDKRAQDDPVFGHPADAFVSHILAEAWRAKADLHWQSFEGTKAELRAERNDLLKLATELEGKLRKISLDLDRLLGIDADSLGCADKLIELIQHVKAAEQAIDRLPRLSRKDEKDHRAAVEMTIRVLRALKEYGISPTATADADFGYASAAVRILKLIGDDIRLVLSEVTWRDIIIEVKDSTPDLQ